MHLPFFARGLFALAALATGLGAGQLPVKVYSLANGMPRNTVRCLVPSPSGLLWMCTTEGLARFDGHEFRVFGTEHGLPSRSIVDLIISRNGGFWLVTESGVCRMPLTSKTGDKCSAIKVDEPPGDYQNSSLVELTDGTVWIGTSRGIFRLPPGGTTFQRARFVNPPGEILCLGEGAPGSLLVGTGEGLFEWREGRGLRNIVAALGPVGVSHVLTERSAVTWLGTPRGLVRVTWGASEAPAVDVFPAPGVVEVRQILRRANGSLWISGVGMSRLEVGPKGELREAQHFSPDQGLPDVVVPILVEDKQGDLWGATINGSGIFRIVDSGFTGYAAADGLGRARIASIFEDLEGRVCVRTSWDGYLLRVQNGDHFDPIKVAYPANVRRPGGGWNQFGLQAHDGEWWIPSGEGLLRFPKSRAEELSKHSARLYDARSELGSTEVFRVFEDSNRDIWVSSLTPKFRLTRWDHTTEHFHDYTREEGWPQTEAATVIREGSAKVLWIGTNDAVARYRNGHFEFFPLVVNGQAPIVRDLYLDHSGRLWIATLRAGILRCDHPETPTPVFVSYTTREGLATNSTRSVTDDNSGYIYAGTALGVDRIDPAAPIEAHRIHHFTTADGLPDSEHNAVFRDRRGHIWFGTLHGLAEFDPAKSPRYSAPAVYLNRLRVRGEELPLPWEGARELSLDLAANRNQLEIDYAGIDLRSVASLRYQYRLGGADHDWSAPGDALNVNYASLPPGHFRFSVRAVTTEGDIGPEAGFDLAVQSALWRRPWFLALAAVLLSAMAVVLYNYRVKQLLAIERLRTRIATDLHDDIGASLTQISILSEVARSNSAPHVLSDIATLAREMVEEMSDIVWAVNPRHDRFEELVHRMRRFSADTLGDIELEFDSGALPPNFTFQLEQRRPLYLVFKEAVNNVSRHSGATKASILLEQDHAALRLTVVDDGCGFDTSERFAGEGLASIRKRMRDVGGTATWTSELGCGTRFVAVFPIVERTSPPKLRGIFSALQR